MHARLAAVMAAISCPYRGMHGLLGLHAGTKPACFNMVWCLPAVFCPSSSERVGWPLCASCSGLHVLSLTFVDCLARHDRT